MAPTRQELLKSIYEATKVMSAEQGKAHFQPVRQQNPVIRNDTAETFAGYWLKQDAKEREKTPAAPPIPTADQLWSAVADWEPDPLRPSPHADPIPILRLIASPVFPPIPLGKLRGEIECALEPARLCLEPDDTGHAPSGDNTTMAKSNHLGIHAIRYADAHPSEGNVHLNWYPGEKPGTMNRYLGLGWVLMKIEGDWVKTGHVLVIDADHAHNCHPFFVLAAEWEADDEAYILGHGTEFKRPAKTVKKNDPTALGVLPGNKSRTTIARLVCHGMEEQEGVSRFPFRSFGENFSFDFLRMGKGSTEIRSEFGPSLPEIMDWWWDPVKKREVCCTSRGFEYLSYDPESRAYDPLHDLPQDEVGNVLE